MTRNHRPQPLGVPERMEFERILIVKLSSMGDILHALPALSAVRARFPKAHIAWLVKREWAALLEGHPDLDAVIAEDVSLWRWPAVVARLRRLRFGLAIDLQGLFRSAALAWLCGAPERIGFAQGREGAPWFYTQRVGLPNLERRPWRLIDMHAVDRNLAVMARIGADISRPAFRLPTYADAEQGVQTALSGVKSGERLVAIAPVDRRQTRSWPLERFVAVAATLSRQPGLRIVLIGTPSQRAVVEPFRRAVGDRLIDLVGRTTLPELAVLFRRVHVLVANDSGPIHLAAAVGTRVVALFGPTNHLRAAPYGEGHEVLRTPLSCSPCERRICTNRQQYECLTSLAVEEVVGSVIRQVRQAS